MSILKQVLQVFLFLSLLSSTFAFSLSALSTISDTIDSFLSENSLSLNSSIEESNLLLEEKKALRSQRLALLLEHQKENAKTKSLEKAETATVLTTKEKKALSALSFVSEKALESLGSKEADKEQNYVFVSTDDKGRLTLERFKGNKTLFFEKLYKGDIQAIFENEVYTSQAYDQAKEIAQYDDFLRSYPSSGGSGVKVAVLDSGTEDLSFQVVFTQDFTNSSTGTKDIFGHGKYVEDLLLSFAPDVSVYSMKVLDDTGVGDSFAVYEAIETAIQEGVDIISLSFGKTENDSLVQGIIEQALEEDILLVAAAGNCRQGCGDFSGVLFPASMQDVIAVGSISPQIEPSSFSSSQDFVSYTKPDLVAVGEDLGTPTGKLVQGTSFAVPQVSAALALRLQDRNLSVAQVFDLLSVSSTDLGERGKDLDFGFGLLNVGGIFGLETQFNLSTYQTGQKESEEAPFIFQSNIFTETFPVHENATLWFSFSPVANASTNPSIVFKVRDLEKKTVILDQFSLNQSYNFSYTYTPETVEDILPSLWFSVDGNEYYLSPLYKIRGDEEVFVNFDSAPEHFWKNESLDVQLSITNMANHSLPLEVKLEFEGQVPNTTFSPASVTIEVPTGQSTANLSFSLDFIENMTLNGKVFTRHNNRDYVQTSPNSSFVSTLRTPQTVFVSHFVHEEILPFGGILNIYGVLENAENFTSFCVVSFEIFDVNNESLDESRVGYVPVSSPKLFNKAYRLSPLFVAGTYSLETRFSCEEQEFTLSSSFSVGETNTSFENLSNDYAQTLANLLGSSGLNEKDFLQTQVLSYNEHTLLEEVARSYVAQLVDEDDFVECDFATNAEGNARCTYAVYRNGVIKNEVGKTSLDTEKNALGAAGVYIQELNRNYFGTAFTLNYGYNALAFDWQTHGETCPSNLSGTCALSSYELRSSKGTELLGLSTTVPYVQVETTELGSSYLATSGEFQLEISSVGQSTISSSDHKTYSIISRSQKIGLECVSDYTCSNGRSCVAYENQTGKGTSCQCTQISALIQSCLSEKTGAYCDGNVECESGICENNVCSSGTICYRDADGDGYGSVFSTALSSSGSCGSINGLTYVKNSDDCDDSSSAKTTYKQLYRDADGDGYPGTLSFVCSSGTSTPSGYSSSNTDCDDGTSSLSAYVHEDTRWYEDADKDGFPREGSIIITCERPSANFYPDEYLVAQKSFWSSVLDLESDCNDEEFNSENECVDTNMCPNGRDGSSRACSCSSDNQCNGQTPFCVNLPNQFGYCWYDKSVLSECESENSFSCSANTLYRCVNDGSGKLVKKAELFCSANYACSADQGRCVLANGYSIRLDYSLEQQNVYKKHGSSFVARLQIEGTAYGSPLVYDTNVFSSECPSGSPISGSYKECLFTVKSSAETGETLIKHGPAIATINILDDSEPAVNLYLTHSERMIQEYGEDSRDTVDLIVTKLYGKAAKEKGIVMDLAAYEKTQETLTLLMRLCMNILMIFERRVDEGKSTTMSMKLREGLDLNVQAARTYSLSARTLSFPALAMNIPLEMCMVLVQKKKHI
ncbi:S8 family serine peptidase [Candidatus Woesearchaeota archaeon]|nr:S8 family serine peptidase [Candidatus Woesearchaeota archaeon]